MNVGCVGFNLANYINILKNRRDKSSHFVSENSCYSSVKKHKSSRHIPGAFVARQTHASVPPPNLSYWAMRMICSNKRVLRNTRPNLSVPLTHTYVFVNNNPASFNSHFGRLTIVTLRRMLQRENVTQTRVRNKVKNLEYDM